MLKDNTLEGKNNTQDSIGSLKNEYPAKSTRKNNDRDGGILGLFAGLKVPINEVVHCRYKNGKMPNFPDHYPAIVLKNNKDGSINVKFIDGNIIQRQVCRNDVKELRVPLQLFNLRWGLTGARSFICPVHLWRPTSKRLGVPQS